MAAKDVDLARATGGDAPARQALLVGEVADLWFHSLITLAYYGLAPSAVLAELQRRAGTSGIEEKALRKAQSREQGAHSSTPGESSHG